MQKDSKNGVIASVSSSKLARINKLKELMEDGKIYFDPIKQQETERLIIGCDFGKGKDESRKHILYYC